LPTRLKKIPDHQSPLIPPFEADSGTIMIPEGALKKLSKKLMFKQKFST